MANLNDTNGARHAPHAPHTQAIRIENASRQAITSTGIITGIIGLIVGLLMGASMAGYRNTDTHSYTNFQSNPVTPIEQRIEGGNQCP